MKRAHTTFISHLSAKRRGWQSGDLLTLGLHTLGIAALVLTLYMLADAYQAFTPQGLQLGNIICLFIVGASAVLGLLNLAARSLRETAKRVDQSSGSSRRSVQSALDLADQEASTPLNQFLIEESFGQAIETLRNVPAFQLFDRKRFLLVCGMATTCIALCAVLIFGYPALSRVVLSRILNPAADIPPFSNLAFAITPDNPQVLYGDDLELSAEITGGPVADKVWMHTRRDGVIKKAACFRDGTQRYNQRLEKVVAPMEVRFATGKARSEWRSVEVQLQPVVTATEMTIHPPSYTRLPSRTFRLGAEPVQGYAASELELHITSNRPLAGGILQLDTGEVLHEVVGRVIDLNTVAFSWSLNANAHLEISVHDLRGVHLREALQARQVLLVDEKPYVTISNPPRFALATPTTKLPIEGYAEDDLQIKDVELVRAMVGYRDRPQTLAQNFTQQRYEHTGEIDLEALGTQAGQTLEFYLEATDSHPGQLGIGVSDIIRVSIISEEEYATLLRNREQTSQLSKRFNLAYSKIKQMTDKLKEMQQSDDPEEQERLRKEAEKIAHEASAVFKALAKDFPIYEIEREARPILRTMADEMKQNASEIARMSPGNPSFARDLKKMLDRLTPQQEHMKEQSEQVEGMAQAGEVMKKAIAFRQMVQKQEDLVRQMSRFANDYTPSASSRMTRLAEQEKTLRDELEQLAKELRSQAQALPDIFHDLKYGAIHFVDVLEESDVLPPMASAADAGQNQQHAKAHEQAKLALERMKALTDGENKDNSFCKMCKGGMPKFDVKDSVQNTLAQMLAALQQKRGQGNKPGEGQSTGGSGGGPGGDTNDGYAIGGQSTLNVPLFGPSRSSVDLPRGAAIDAGPGLGGEQGRHLTQGHRSTFENSNKIVNPEGGLPVERVPPKYRDAIKRYFTPGEAP